MKITGNISLDVRISSGKYTLYLWIPKFDLMLYLISAYPNINYVVPNLI